MKIFANQKIWRKIVIALLIVMMFQFFTTSPVRAENDDNGIGGKLMEPIIDLVVFLGDRNCKSYS